MQILVASAFQKQSRNVTAFLQNTDSESVFEHNTSGESIEFKVDGIGTSGFMDGIQLALPEQLARIKNTHQLRLVLTAHDLVSSAAGEVAEVTLRVRPAGVNGYATNIDDVNTHTPVTEPQDGKQITYAMATCAAAGGTGGGCGAVGCATVGCAAAGAGGGGCAAAGCAGVGCAAAGCGAVGCATVACAAAGKGGGGCAAAACGAVGCAANGCAAAACGAVACALNGCATVACGAATGACGAAACGFDALCGANAGWPP
ncbi:hypothetical protein ACO0LM_07320 [Undibacterium sp. Di26W]|uniref:hypothetical protein n=1 Tax=Undibacterium sp. Di26W TaxID=3413035 RepID=UPI003BF38545